MERSDDMELISIIINVYNSEKYIKKCLDSIINQTYKNLEILIINDGSTDKTLKMMFAHANKKEKIKLLLFRLSPTLYRKVGNAYRKKSI